MGSVEEGLEDLVRHYDDVVKNLEDRAAAAVAAGQRKSAAGYIRSQKGKLQEDITDRLVHLAWFSLGQPAERLKIDSAKVPIPIRQGYIEGIEDAEVQQHIKENLADYTYKLSVDKHVYIDGEFVLAIECKSYAENAMLKRVLIDFDLLLTQYPELSCYLLQLESQLGGDYSQLRDVTYGSRTTHTLLSYFKVELKIVTLLGGERKVGKPIHKHFKPLAKDQLRRCLELLIEDLKRFV